MPGLYTHTTRTDGTVLTGAIYNADHQNHIDNLIPAQIDDYSVTQGQMQSLVNPGEVGSESFALSLAGEVERLRFIISETKGTTHWYTSVLSRVETLCFTSDQLNHNHWYNLIFTRDVVFWRVPESYISGDVTLSFLWIPTDTSAGIAQMGNTIKRHRVGAASTTLANEVTFTLDPSTTNTTQENFLVPAANFTVGDMLEFHIFRDGGHASDTYAGIIFCVGVLVSFNAYAGRP